MEDVATAGDVAEDETVTVDMEESATVVVLASLGEVEPDVRLNMTFPARIGIGSVLPRVAIVHALVDKLPGPLQQKDEPVGNGNIAALWTPARRQNLVLWRLS